MTCQSPVGYNKQQLTLQKKQDYLTPGLAIDLQTHLAWVAKCH